MAKLEAKVTADISGFSAAMKKCQAIARGLKPIMTGIGIVAAGAMAAITAAAAGIKHALDIGGELSELSARTGVAAGQLAVLQLAFQRAGIGADMVGPMFNRMQKTIAAAGAGSKEAQDALRRIGLSAEQLAAMSPEKQFEAIGKAIAAIPDPAAQAAAAMAIFGKSGGALLALFKDPAALADAARALGSQAELLSKNANMFDRAADILNTIGIKLQGFFVGLADQIVPVLMPLLEKIDGLDFAKLGQELGRAAAMFITAITDGRIWEIIGLSLQISLRQAINNIWATLNGVAAAWLTAMIVSGKTFLKILLLPSRPEFWMGLKDALVGAAIVFGQKMAYFIADILAMFSQIPGLANLLQEPLASAIKLGDDLAGQANAPFASAESILMPLVDDIAKTAVEGIKQIGTDFVNGINSATPIFDNTELQQKLNGIWAELGQSVEDANQAAQDKYGQSKPQIPDMEDLATREKGRFGALFASSLAKIGGGGYAVGGNSLLDENRKQTSYLQRIANALTRENATPALA